VGKLPVQAIYYAGDSGPLLFCFFEEILGWKNSFYCTGIHRAGPLILYILQLGFLDTRVDGRIVVANTRIVTLSRQEKG
jgi:hypothetical protein